MKKIIILTLMILFYHFLAAQNDIHGKITDPEGSPLQGSTAFIPDLNKGAVADAAGNYSFTGLPDGEIRIQYAFLGYATQVKTLIIKGISQEINVKLVRTPIEAEAIVISGGYHSTQHENAVKIDVLRLEQQKLKSTPNFMEMLRKIPGVNMISKGSGVSKPVIRGLSMNDVLVLNNGVRYENYQYSDHHPLGITEAGIEEVEVIKGPASLLYGSDAIGGVINFIKEKPAPVGSIEGDYNLGLFSNSQGIQNNLGVKGTSKNFWAGVRLSQKSHADYLQGGGAWVPNSRFSEMSLKANSGFSNKTGTFRLFYEMNDQNLGLVEDEAVEMISERGRKNEIFYQKLSTHLISSQNKLYLGKFRLDINPAFQSTELIHFGEKDQYELQMVLNTLTYEAKLNLPSDENSEYIVGIQGMNQMNTNLNDRETMLLPDAAIFNYSVFALIQNTLAEKLKLQAGIRYDIRKVSTDPVGEPDAGDYRPSLEKEYGSMSGSVGLVYSISEFMLFRTNLAAAYRTPNLAELTSNGLHELRYEIGQSGLLPQRSREADLSLHFHKENVTVDLALFFNYLYHYIFIAPTGDTTDSGIEIYMYDQSDSYLYGGEAGVHFHPASASWLHFESTFSTVTGQRRDGTYLPFIPASNWQSDIRAEREKLGFFRDAFISLSMGTTFNQNNPAPEESETEGYFLTDIMVGGKIRMNERFFYLTFGINNLFDTQYVDHLSTLKESGFFNPGRNFALNLKLPFGSGSK